MENTFNAIALIPSRFGSERLPGKPLIDICGKTLIHRVWEACCSSRLLRRIIVTTDDDRIAETCLDIGAEYIITPSDIKTGTDRIIYSYKYINEDADIILNVQGDEPLITGDMIDSLISDFSISKADAGTIIKKIDNPEELFNPSVVKVVLKEDLTALYFSRNPIPFIRDIPENLWISRHDFWKHIGIYCFKKDTLLRFQHLRSNGLESAEKLEQLRLLENGLTIKCFITDTEMIGVDTTDDLLKVRQFICGKS